MSAPQPLTGDELTDWLLSQIAADEAAAREATPGPWTAGREPGLGWVIEADGCWPAITQNEEGSQEDAAHIATHDPARVLAECAAKRRIVAGLVDAEAAVARTDPDNLSAGDWQEWGNRHAWHEAACILASVFADRDGFDEAWALGSGFGCGRTNHHQQEGMT